MPATRTGAQALRRETLPLCVGTLNRLVERLDAQPETRCTIVQAVCLSVALVDFQACYLGLGGWHGACKAARQRLAEMVALVDGMIDTGPPARRCSYDLRSPTVIGTRGPANPRAALRLAHVLTEHVAFEPPERGLTPDSYCRLIVEVMALFMAVVVQAMQHSALTPESERDLGHYQLCLWEAYAQLYGEET